MWDATKRALCATNGMRLVEVDPDSDIANIVRRIRDMLDEPE